jgi:hypothetical protein
MDQTENTGMPSAPTASSSKKGWIIGIIVIIVLIGSYFMLRGGSDQATPGIVAGDQNSITVGDQNADSVAVLVSDVSLRAPGYIEIHADDNGKVGAIVGSSSLLQPGDHKNVSVIATLLPGKSYYAMLHTDDGNGTFDPAKDEPTLDNAGNIIMTKFNVRLTNEGGEVKG